MPDGILNLNKPAGWTSHDVVARVRRIMGQRSVGHAGTLDPLATGVLLVCVGKATRIVEYLTASDKVYRAEARLGIVTDTYDISGAVVGGSPVPRFSTAEIERALRPFIGDIQQVPPVYSALKRDGIPMYQRARRGEAIEMTARPVTVHAIEVLRWQPPDLVLEVRCGPGTYIRSLVHDLGQSLGCGATLAGLERTRSGQFSVANAATLEELAVAAESGEPDRHLLPLSAALSGLQAVPVDALAQERLVRGQQLPCTVKPDGAIGYAVSSEGDVVAILQYDADRHAWQPHKVFVTGVVR